MKHFILLLLLLTSLPILSAEKLYEFSFSESQFKFDENEDGALVISAPADWSHENNADPGLPIMSAVIAMPYGARIGNYTITSAQPRLIRENIEVAPNPAVVTTAESFKSFGVNNIINYSDDTYPKLNCEYLGISNFEGVALENFKVCPFIYDSKEHNLYFIDSLGVNLEFAPYDAVSSSKMDIQKIKNILSGIVFNKEELDGILAQIPNSTYYYNEDRIDYLIITTPELLSCFHRLLEWKRIKGIYGGIITIDEIRLRYEGADLTAQIKHCIYDAHLNYGLKYVVLAGDIDMIPTRKCYAKAYPYTGTLTPQIEENMPCDKYYGCFGGDFQWDGNGNGIFGEIDDNIDFTESVYVSRISVRNENQANAYISKLLDYETGSSSERLKKSMITAGVEKEEPAEDWMYDENGNFLGFNSGSDTQVVGDNLYLQFIRPYWDGNRISFYDTRSSFTNYNVIPENVQKVLVRNDIIFSMSTHGTSDRWMLEGAKKMGGYEKCTYKVSHAESLNGSTIPIIITEACLTNHFDDENDPCLSEAFIRSGTNSVVAYLGGTRYGWRKLKETKVNLSSLYEGQFYRYLFDKKISSDKNIGEVLGMAKLSMQSQCFSENPERWIQMSLALQGDAEMPVFTEAPQTLAGKVEINFSPSNRSLNIKSNIGNCRFSVINPYDNGESFHEVIDNAAEGSFSSLPSFFIICITKQNYIPYLYFINNTPAGVLEGKAWFDIYGLHTYTWNNSSDNESELRENKFVEIDSNNNLINVTLTEEMASDEKIELRHFTGGVQSLNYEGLEKFSIDMNGYAKGVYVLTLRKNEQIVDTRKICY